MKELQEIARRWLAASRALRALEDVLDLGPDDPDDSDLEIFDRTAAKCFSLKMEYIKLAAALGYEGEPLELLALKLN